LVIWTRKATPGAGGWGGAGGWLRGGSGVACLKENATIFHWSADKPPGRIVQSSVLTISAEKRLSYSYIEDVPCVLKINRARRVDFCWPGVSYAIIIAFRGCSVHRINVQSSSVPDAVAIIAVCASSRPLAEMAIALKLISNDELSLPSGSRHAASKSRIAQTVSSLFWRVEARAAMSDPQVEELAFLFYQICLQRVPTNSPNPIADDDWLLRVRELFLLQKPLQVIAGALLDQFPLPEAYEEAPHDSVSPQPAAESESIPASPVAASAAPISPQPIAITNSRPSPSPARDVRAELLARLRLIAKAKRFVDQLKKHHDAKQASLNAAQAAGPPPAPALASEKLQASAALAPELTSKSIKPNAGPRRICRHEPLRRGERSNGNTKQLNTAVVRRSYTRVHRPCPATTSLLDCKPLVPFHDKHAYPRAHETSSRWSPMLRAYSRISGKAWYIRGSTRASGEPALKGNGAARRETLAHAPRHV